MRLVVSALLVGGLVAGCRSRAASPPRCPDLPSPPSAPASSCPCAPAASRAPELDTPPARLTLTPGVGIGPLRFGMSRDEVAALRVLQRHPKFALETTPYQVGYDDHGRVVRIAVSLLGAPRDVEVGRTTIPRGARFSEVRTLLEGCEAPDVGFGGGRYTCNGGTIEVLGGSGAPNETWLVIHVSP
ncbi:MAG: hypothetical protein U0270_02025 [Labilithrix sp.]